ncbi:hypothetical protein ACHAQJ_007356 [Trichoderma viride]
MNKRKLINDRDQGQSYKRVKLDPIHDARNSQTRDAHFAPSLPSSLATPKLLKKRKADDSEIIQLEKPDVKRLKIAGVGDQSDLTRGAISRGSTAWPSIGYKARPKKEVDAVARDFLESSLVGEMFKELFGESEDEDYRHTTNRNPLPSPAPSEGDAAESDTDELVDIDSTRGRYPTPKDLKALSPRLEEASSSHRRKKTRTTRQRIEKRSTAQSRKQTQPPSPKKKKTSRRQSRNQKPSSENANLMTILASKRSSRGDATCDLWYLDDDGFACAR